MVEAVIWDFGGVFTTSPFDAFNRFERERGLPVDVIRRDQPANHLDNAWARFERAEVDAPRFDALFATESRALGHDVRGKDVLPLLSGDLRPEMVEALKRVKAQFKIGCITNNLPANAHRQPQRPFALGRRSDGAVRSRHRNRPRSACESPIRASTR